VRSEIQPELWVDDVSVAIEFHSQAVAESALAAGAKIESPVSPEHGWQLGRIVDPFGHEWEIGRPLIPWPPAS
jgi:uncharacterized glyoxalase superfamily protein PhnB